MKAEVLPGGTVPCKCSGEFKIIGGEYIGQGRRTAIVAACCKCETVLYENQEDIFSIIRRYNAEPFGQIMLINDEFEEEI